ncbi:MAG: methionyl-tRNA formyltransferase [Verrucomicrobia bacterium]|nr:MAG: methionyl-tRNA formyltransferase [Verrucomicrobiota bacterium]PYL48859.1 MAG: methionyl-tRNA formyltransferase [Verrucomicrobiota bacterium]
MASRGMRIIFIGTGEIGVPTLRALLNSEHEVIAVVTQPDKPVGRDQRIEPPPIKTALIGRARPPGAPIFQPARIKDPQAIEQIRSRTPDAIVVVAYGQILPHDVLEIPRLACLNVHASLLPRWRGAAPLQAAIAAGDFETGITVMYMDEGLDTGDILLQRNVEILPNDTGGSLHDRLAQIAPEALLESLRLIAAGSAPRIRQDNARATYAPKLKREHGQIDWSESAAAIERKIRAYNPWPGAFMKVGDQNLKIFSASVVDLTGQPGEILRSDKDLIVAAGKGALCLAEVQLEGKRRMSGAEFLRGHGALPGAAD